MNPIEFIPFIAIGLVFYFLILRPQAQEREAMETMLASLAKDQWVVVGGLHGRVVKVEEETVVLEVSEKTRVTVDKQSITRRLD